jgi:hypothetical protein
MSMIRSIKVRFNALRHFSAEAFSQMASRDT